MIADRLIDRVLVGRIRNDPLIFEPFQRRAGGIGDLIMKSAPRLSQTLSARAKLSAALV